MVQKSGEKTSWYGKYPIKSPGFKKHPKAGFLAGFLNHQRRINEKLGKSQGDRPHFDAGSVKSCAWKPTGESIACRGCWHQRSVGKFGLWHGALVWNLGVFLESSCECQINSRPKTRVTSPQMVVNSKGNETPAISGKSRMVKYYNLARSWLFFRFRDALIAKKMVYYESLNKLV